MFSSCMKDPLDSHDNPVFSMHGEVADHFDSELNNSLHEGTLPQHEINIQNNNYMEKL